MGTCQEPEPGWLDAIQGNTAFFIGAYLGLIHCNLAHPGTTSLIPSDYAANIILTAAWYSASKSSPTSIYNYIGCNNNLMTGGKFRLILSFIFQLLIIQRQAPLLREIIHPVVSQRARC